MSLKLEWVPDERTLFSDNVFVGRWRDRGAYYFYAHISERYASISRYCVPGRLDAYSFGWVPGQTGVGDRVTFFTDMHLSLSQASKQVKRDLKKKQVVELLKAARLKCPRSYLDYLIDALR